MSINELKAKLIIQPIPSYSKQEETFNWISHLVGAVIGFILLVIFISLSIINNYSVLKTISLIAYSLSLMFLYSVSTIYHYLNNNSPWKRIFRILDHNTIYVLIAGTYAPICALGFNDNPNIGLIMIIIEVVLLILGSTLNFINMNNKFIKIITIVLYVVMGWLVAFCYPAILLLDFQVMLYVLLGGIAYTLGVLFYVVGKKKKWMHSVFHIFVLLGSILQLIGIIILL